MRSKTKTERTLLFLTILALLVGIGYAIVCGSHLIALVASFESPDFAKRMYAVDEELFVLLEYKKFYFIGAISFAVVLAAVKACVWFLVMNLLLKLKLSTPFSRKVARKIGYIAYLVLGIWLIGIAANVYMDWLRSITAIDLGGFQIGDEYLFIAGIVYVISQLFVRGVEMQDANT